MKRFWKLYTGPLVILLFSTALFACSGSGSTPAGGSTSDCNNLGTNVTSEQIALQKCTGAYMAQTHTAGWFPLASQKGPTAEMSNDAAREVRLNDPNRIGYFYGLSSTGQVMMFLTIRGKVSSTGSELANTENAIGRAGNGNVGGTVVSSPGDDGTFGNEECQGQGVFFFTADTNALGEWCGPWAYFDAPLKLSTVPIITASAQAPTSGIPAGGSTKK